MTTLPTAAQITSLFLYGSDTPPTGGALASQNLPNHAVGVLPDIDFKEFMETGPGRFANASQSALITQFFLEGGDNPPGRHLQPGESMTAAEFAAATGLELTYQVKQLFYHDANESTLDIASRVYIYNTQEFSINADARFVVDANGTYRIENLRIERPEDDNFDFVGGSLSSNVANQYLQPRVDPWNIGKQVDLKYSGDFVIGDYGVAQFNHNRDYILDSYAPISTPVITILSGLTDQLFSDGTSRFIDQDGRAIIYSKNLASQIDVNTITGAFNDRSGDYSFVANRAPLLVDAAQSNGIYWVGDNGVDNVKAGGKDDVLKGYAGNDVFEGRGGADILDGGSGVDRASYESSDEGVTVDLALGTGIGVDAEGDTLISIENVDGSDFGDKLSGNTGNNVLRGADGNDLLQGLQGADRLYGEDNDDRLVGGEGVDSLYGGNGSDLLILGTLEDRPAGLGSGGAAEIADGGAGRDYIVLTDADTDTMAREGTPRATNFRASSI